MSSRPHRITKVPERFAPSARDQPAHKKSRKGEDTTQRTQAEASAAAINADNIAQVLAPEAHVELVEAKAEDCGEQNALAPAGAQVEHHEANVDGGAELNVLAPAPANGDEPVVQNMTSSRKGDVKAHDGYKYYFDQILQNGYRSYRCRKKKCYGRIWIKVGGLPSIQKEHNHPRDPVQIQVEQERAHMRKRAMETDERPKSIISSSFANMSPMLAKAMPSKRTIAKSLNKVQRTRTASSNRRGNKQLGNLTSTVVAHDLSTSQNHPVPSSGAAVTKGQKSTVAKPLAKPVPKVHKLAPKDPLSNTTTLVPHASSASQKSSGATVTKGQYPRVNPVSEQHDDAEIQRPGGSGTQAQPSSKTRPRVQVVSVEHGPAIAMPDPAVSQPTGSGRKRSKKAKLGESEQDRIVRLFHAAREAHNIDADLSIRCEKFIEFIVDEYFIGRIPQDRQEIFGRLLEMCMQGMTLEDITCDDPQKMGVLKAYSKRLQAWNVIRDLFPDLMGEFKAQPRVLSPFHVLTADAFKKVNEYMGELKATMPSLPKVLKEAVVWQLLGSVGHRYEQYDEGVHKRVAELIRKNVP